jgi:hypothetical protein
VLVNFELLALGTSFDIIPDECIHSWPINILSCLSVCLLFSRVSSGGVVMVSLDNSLFQDDVIGDNDSVFKEE